MLYIYHYPKGHKLEKLNEHLVYFLSKIKDTKPNAKFVLSTYFDSEFELILKRSSELRDKFKTFFNTFKKLSSQKKEEFYKLVVKCQKIEDFFSDDSIDCTDIKRESLDTLLGDQSFNILVTHLFKTTLRSFDIEGHYEIIYNKMLHKICPFCGVEIMHQSFREDYDHLAAKSHYPIAGVNPKNLAPMCHTCNSKNKGEKDVLHRANGTRRKMVYPYTEKLDLNFDYSGSIIPQTDINNQSGKWEIKIIPDNELTKVWNEIFGIKKRYTDDFLDPSFEEWVNDFITECIEAGKELATEAAVINELNQTGNRFNKKWHQNANIIRGPLFEYLSKCGNKIFYDSIIKRYTNLINGEYDN